jgi:hypothetical protein
MRRPLTATILGVVASLAIASSAFAFECTNVSKSDPAAGAQILMGPSGEILWMKEGLAQRLERGLIDPETGEGFHGQIAFDFDGDGLADASVYFGVGPDGEIPLDAQLKGPACRGLTNIGLYFSECLGG